MRKHDVNKINLEINEIYGSRYANETSAFTIKWSSDLGFGIYEIYIDEKGNIIGHSETMDSNEDKSFLKKLFELLTEKIDIQK